MSSLRITTAGIFLLWVALTGSLPASAGTSASITWVPVAAASAVGPAGETSETAENASPAHQQPPRVNFLLGILIALGPILAAVLLIFRKRLNRSAKPPSS